MFKFNRVSFFGVGIIFLYIVVYSLWYTKYQVVGYLFLTVFVFLMFASSPSLHNKKNLPYLFVFIIIICITNLFTSNLGNSFFSLLYFLFVIFLAILTAEVVIKNNLIFYYLVSLSIASVIVQFRSFLIIEPHNYRFSGITDQSNSFGFIMSASAIISLIAIYIFYKNKDIKIYRIFLPLHFFSFLVSLYFLFGSGSRGAMLSFLCSALYFIYLSGKGKFKKTILLLLLSVFTSIVFKSALLESVAFNRVMAIPSALGFNYNYNYQVQIGAADNDIRAQLANEVFEFVKERPILGYGANSYGEYSKYRFNYTHSNYLELLFSFGVLGFSFYYIYLFSHIKFYNIKRYFDGTDLYARAKFTLFVFILLSGVSIPNYSNFSMYIVYTLFFIMSHYSFKEKSIKKLYN